MGAGERRRRKKTRINWSVAGGEEAAIEEESARSRQIPAEEMAVAVAGCWW
jgi:hypothetical protein